MTIDDPKSKLADCVMARAEWLNQMTIESNCIWIHNGPTVHVSPYWVRIQQDADYLEARLSTGQTQTVPIDPGYIADAGKAIAWALHEQDWAADAEAELAAQVMQCLPKVTPGAVAVSRHLNENGMPARDDGWMGWELAGPDGSRALLYSTCLKDKQTIRVFRVEPTKSDPETWTLNLPCDTKQAERIYRQAINSFSVAAGLQAVWLVTDQQEQQNA